MFRPPSKPDLFCGSQDQTQFRKELRAGFEEVIKSVLAPEFELTEISIKEPQANIPCDTLYFKIRNKKDDYTFERAYNFMNYKSKAKLAATLSLDFFAFYLNKLFPKLSLSSIDVQTSQLRLINPKNLLQDFRIDRLEEIIDPHTQVFSFDALAKYYPDIPEEAKGQSIKNPLIILPERIERACDMKNVIIAPFDPGEGNAVFITGAHKSLGQWGTAHRLEHTRDHGWRFSHNGAVGEFKFLFGSYDLGSKTDVERLHYEDGFNRRICELPPSSPSPVQSPYTFNKN